jgi:DNA repair exonuclease SbcCD ATPase subunit
VRKLKFKKVKAENFVCFESIIVVFIGKNLDVKDNDSSNGVGKTSTIFLPIYALFGKTTRKVGHSNTINYKNGKKLEVEFYWDEYRVVRTSTPGKVTKNTLRLWKSEEGRWDKDTEITLGSMTATQELIEKIIGLNYETFINIYIFSDDPSTSFLECDTPTKREIVENLLSLDKYRTYWDNAKSYVKVCKDKIKSLTKDYERCLEEQESCCLRLNKIKDQEKNWQKTKERDLFLLLEEIKNKKNQLENSDNGVALAQWQEAQDQLIDLQNSIPLLEKDISRLNELLKDAEPKLLKLTSKHQELALLTKEQSDFVNACNKNIADNKKIIDNIQGKIGKDCPYCLGKVDESKFSNMLTHAEKVIKEEIGKKEAIEGRYRELANEMEETGKKKVKIEVGIAGCRVKLSDTNKKLADIHMMIRDLSRIKEPDVSSEERRIQEQIEGLKERVDVKKGEKSPFGVIREGAREELEVKDKEVVGKKGELDRAEGELPYYEFWVKAFGEGGIRKYVIEGIIPALNNRIAYWLQFLIDNKIKLEFDNELNEKIDRYPFMGRPYIYHGLSGGQRRRLNLTVSQAFAYIMMLNCGASPSVVFLDEVTMNMDVVGVEGIYRMICELAKEKQVFVIDHNENLLRLLQGCDTIKLEMRDEITRMVK